MFDAALIHFLQMHPEYKETITQIKKSEHNWKGMIDDIRKMTRGEYTRFMTGAPAYSYPETISSIEHALAEMMAELQKYHPQMKTKLPSVLKNKNASDYATSFLKEKGDQWLSSVLQQFELGIVVRQQDLVRNSTIQDAIQMAPRNANKEAIGRYLVSAVAQFAKAHAQDLHVLVEGMSREVASHILNMQLLHAKQEAGQIVNRFASSWGGEGTSTQGLIIGKALEGDFTRANFSNAQLTGAVIDQCMAINADFSGADFSKSKVSNCDFTGAKFVGANFKSISSFTDNDISHADFREAVLQNKDFPNMSNKGEPVNLTFKELWKHDVAHAKMLVNQPDRATHSINMGEGEKNNARHLIKALDGVLRGRSLLSFMLRKASLSPEDVASLKAWIEDPAKVPPLVAGKSADVAFKEMVERNKSGELRASGLSGADVNKLFGRCRNLMASPALEVDPAELARQAKDKSIQDFITRHAGSKSIPASELLALLDKQEVVECPTCHTKGPASAFEDSDEPDTMIYRCPNEKCKNRVFARPELDQLLASYGNRPIPQTELNILLHGLVSGVKGFHHNDITPVTKHIKSYPHSSHVVDFKNVESAVAGANSGQFGIIDVPNYSMMPRDMGVATQNIIDNTGTHILSAMSFSRIQPMYYDEVPKRGGPPIHKEVWFITEMQSDSFQKGSDLSRSWGLNKGFVNRFRSYFSNWPEVLLNDIIQHAVSSGVDEIWMPQGDDVARKTSDIHVDWTRYYDRPAKAFGGVLKHLPEPVTLDPGSSYSSKCTEAYIIDLSSAKKTAGLKLTFVRYAEAAEAYRDRLIHHVQWVLDNNKDKFPDVAKYVTPEMMIQFAYRTFFDEYQIPAELRNDPEFNKELRDIIHEKFGADVGAPPYLDWNHWMQKAWDDVRFFIKNQKQISPDMSSSDEELARDWYDLWQKETVPQDIKAAPWYSTEFLPRVVAMLKDKGLGDVTDQSFRMPPSPEERTRSITNPTDNDEGEEVLEGPQHELIPGGETEKPQEPIVLPGAPDKHDVRHMIDEYLDKLNKAQQAGNTELADRIKRRLQELSTLSSLNFTNVAKVLRK
jgi:uncharacterized protein YjbI with pentapeptide repeats